MKKREEAQVEKKKEKKENWDDADRWEEDKKENLDDGFKVSEIKEREKKVVREAPKREAKGDADGFEIKEAEEWGKDSK